METNIVIVSDNNYIQHAAVMLCSLFETNKNNQFHIFFLTDSASYDKPEFKESLAKLDGFVEEYGSSLEVISCQLEQISDLPVGQWSTFIYLKLFIPKVLPLSVDRCLFLDVDMIINADISPLYNMTLDENIIAACEDIPDCIEHKSRLRMDQSQTYINSGVMVIDVAKWRQLEEDKPIFDFTREKSDIIINEQDVIALYFAGKIKILPIKWNMVTFYFMRQPKIFDKYLEQLPQARKHPSIIHFAVQPKPWYSDCQHPYRKLYTHYLKMTPWRDAASHYTKFEQLSLSKTIKKKAKRVLSMMNLYKDPMYLSR